MLVYHLFQCRISPWPKTAEKRGYCTCVTDKRTDRQRSKKWYCRILQIKNSVDIYIELNTCRVSLSVPNKARSQGVRD